MNFINKLRNFYDKHNKKISMFHFIVVAVIFTVVILSISLRKNVTVVIDNEPIKFSTYQSTIGKFLEKENIKLYPKDKVDKDLNDTLHKNDTINIVRAVNLKICVDNRELNIKSAEKDISALLKSENISLSKNDKVSPNLNSNLSNGMQINITRVEKKTTTKFASIAYNTIIRKDNSIFKSNKKVLQEGHDGEKQITTNVVYENGKEVSKRVVKEIVTKQPKNKIIVQGTLSPVSSRGSSNNVIKAKATAYWAVNGVGSTYTASGKKAVRNPGGYSTIAVDPRVIPFGTKLYIEGYGYAIAADEGTGVKGNSIDVYFNTYREACNWGLKYVNVHILN